MYNTQSFRNNVQEGPEYQQLWEEMAGSIASIFMATMLSIYKTPTNDVEKVDRALECILSKFSHEANTLVTTITKLRQQKKEVYRRNNRVTLPTPRHVLTCKPNRTPLEDRTVLTCISVEEINYATETCECVTNTTDEKYTQVTVDDIKKHTKIVPLTLVRQTLKPRIMVDQGVPVCACQCAAVQTTTTLQTVVPEVRQVEPKSETLNLSRLKEEELPLDTEKPPTPETSALEPVEELPEGKSDTEELPSTFNEPLHSNDFSLDVEVPDFPVHDVSTTDYTSSLEKLELLQKDTHKTQEKGTVGKSKRRLYQNSQSNSIDPDVTAQKSKTSKKKKAETMKFENTHQEPKESSSEKQSCECSDMSNWEVRLTSTEQALQTLRSRISEMNRVLQDAYNDCKESETPKKQQKPESSFYSGIIGHPYHCHPLCAKLGGSTPGTPVTKRSTTLNALTKNSSTNPLPKKGCTCSKQCVTSLTNPSRSFITKISPNQMYFSPNQSKSQWSKRNSALYSTYAQLCRCDSPGQKNIQPVPPTYVYSISAKKETISEESEKQQPNGNHSVIKSKKNCSGCLKRKILNNQIDCVCSKWQL